MQKKVYIGGVIVGILGIAMILIGFSRIKKMEKEHKKISNDKFLLEHEKIMQKKTLIIFIIGFLLMIISTIISGLVLFEII